MIPIFENRNGRWVCSGYTPVTIPAPVLAMPEVVWYKEAA